MTTVNKSKVNLYAELASMKIGEMKEYPTERYSTLTTYATRLKRGKRCVITCSQMDDHVVVIRLK